MFVYEARATRILYAIHWLATEITYKNPFFRNPVNVMGSIVAIGVAGYAIWKCCKCGGTQGKKKLKTKLKRIQSQVDDDALESWCDRTALCCCLWPLVWRGKFSQGFVGSTASCTCRIMRLFCCMFFMVATFALIGAIAKIMAKADPAGQSFIEIWNATVQRKLAAAASSKEL